MARAMALAAFTIPLLASGWLTARMLVVWRLLARRIGVSCTVWVNTSACLLLIVTGYSFCVVDSFCLSADLVGRQVTTVFAIAVVYALRM